MGVQDDQGRCLEGAWKDGLTFGQHKAAKDDDEEQNETSNGCGSYQGAAHPARQSEHAHRHLVYEQQDEPEDEEPASHAIQTHHQSTSKACINVLQNITALRPCQGPFSLQQTCSKCKLALGSKWWRACRQMQALLPDAMLHLPQPQLSPRAFACTDPARTPNRELRSKHAQRPACEANGSSTKVDVQFPCYVEEPLNPSAGCSSKMFCYEHCMADFRHKTSTSELNRCSVSSINAAAAAMRTLKEALMHVHHQVL